MSTAIDVKSQKLDDLPDILFKTPRSLVELATNAVVVALFKNGHNYGEIFLPENLSQRVINRTIIELAKYFDSKLECLDCVVSNIKKITSSANLEIHLHYLQYSLNLNNPHINPASHVLCNNTFVPSEITTKALQFVTISLTTIDLSYSSCHLKDFRSLEQQLPNLKILNLTRFCLCDETIIVSEGFSDSIKKIISLNPSIKTLLTAYSNLPQDAVLMIPNLTQLKSLSFNRGQATNIPALTFLNSLEMYMLRHDYPKPIAFGSTQLQSLSIINLKDVGDLPVNLCNLTHLNVETNIAIYEWNSFMKWVTNHCTQLTTFSLVYGFDVHLTSNESFNLSLRQLTSLTNLVSFSLLSYDPLIGRSFRIQENGLEFTRKLKSLKNLEIRANELKMENLKYISSGIESLILKPFKMNDSNYNFCMNELGRLSNLTNLGVLPAEKFYAPGFILELNSKLPKLNTLAIDDEIGMIARDDYRERRIHKEGNVESPTDHTFTPFTNWNIPGYNSDAFRIANKVSEMSNRNDFSPE